MSFATRRPALRVPLHWLVCGLLSCYSTSDAIVGDSHRLDLVDELASIGVERTIEPRLSIPMAYHSCARSVPPGATVAGADCRTTTGPEAPAALVDLAARASAQLHREVTPAALATTALIDLLWAEDRRNPLERSISFLRTAAKLADRPAPMLTDLAAALLVRAERQQAPRDLVEAIEAADQALRLEPRNSPARFNLALGLDRLGLEGQAQRAWTAYLDLDSTSGWAGEARRRSQPAAEAAALPAPPPDAAAATIAAYARAAPQQALVFGWDHVLGDWGSAVIAASGAEAGRHRYLASELGKALEQRGGDETLIDAVRAIDRAVGRPRLIRALARAHRDYAAGRAAFRAGQYRAARRSFERVIATDGASPALIAWARLSLASTLVFEGRPAAAETAVRPVTAKADTLRQPALAARARWIVGTSLLRRGRYEPAIGSFRSAIGLFERAGEGENVGAVQQLTADAEQYLGDPLGEYLAIQRALTTLRPYRRSVRLHNLLYATAGVAAADGFPRAAMRLQDEDLEVAARTDRPAYLAEARIARARLAAEAGNQSAAAADLASARAIVRALEPGPERGWFEADLRLAEAATSRSTRPADKIAALDSVIDFFGGQGNVIRLLPALVARSEAAMALGRIPDATADLDHAFSLFAAESARMATRELRASLLDNARRLVDRLVMLRVQSGDPALALADLERARVSLAPVGTERPAAPRAPAAAPTKQILADYALVGDTLLIWTVADTAVTLNRTTIDGARLSRTIERVRTSLELRADDRATLRDLGMLYDWLVGPIEPLLTEPDVPLVVIADGEIAGVPFPALWDRARGQYLIEGHPLRFAASLHDARHTPPKSLVREPRTLFVANPAFDPRAFPRLTPLPGAAAEVEAIAALYADVLVLAGPDATRSTLEHALRQTDILHYAGHAEFDDARPEQSGLVLAPEAASGAGALTAAEIARLDLRHLRLVVLSACETSRPGAGRSGGFAGLTGAILAAGAGGVLGTLWRVDDALTLQLMTDFHRAYRASRDGAASLQAAQLRLLRSSHRQLRSPAAWAAFRYAGT